MINAYGILKVSREATSLEIQTAYNERTEELDSIESTDERKRKSELLQHAFQMISTPERRADYEKALKSMSRH
ncbi:MAG: DnaJ domain [Bacteriovoracaceae bacterium]|nr:DnaJ domain [Bacteriovoracaceae bacterium]